MYNNYEVGLAAGLIVFLVLLYGALLAVVVLNYVLTAKAMYKLSVRRNISCPWMAWIPVLNSWNMGLVANEYDGRLGMKRSWNKILVILHGAVMVSLSLTYSVMFMLMLFVNIQGEFANPNAVIVFAVIMYIFMLAMIFVMVTRDFIAYVVIFKIFESTVPEKAVKYLILSLVVPLALPICLNKSVDKGYPFPEPEVVCEESVITE